MRAAQLHRRRRRRRQLLVPAALVGAVLATSPAARAASTWDGGGTIDNFSDANNWADNLAPTSPLTFDGSVRLTPFNDLNTSGADWGITFAATAGAFTISGGGTSATGAVLRIGTITNSSANAQVMNLDYRLNGTRTIDSGAAGLTVRTIGSTSGTSGRTITKNGAGTLTVNGFGGQASGLMSYAITNGTVEFANATNATLSGLISGVGNLTKSGAGTTILSNAANTYSGTTAVNGGTLLVDGAHNGAGNYTVGAGGTLGGIGAINLVAASNIITVNGTLVPGSATAIESLDIGVGDLALAGTANFQIDLTAATFDDVNVGNLLTYGGVLNVAFTGADTDGATFDIFDFASQGGAFSATNFSGLDSQQNASFDPATGIVTVSAVPEPAAAMAIASLSGLALVRRRRR